LKSILWIGPFILCSVMLAQQAPPAEPTKPATTPPAATPPAKPATTPAKPARAPRPQRGVDDMMSISLFYWRANRGQPGLFAGTQTTTTLSQRLDLSHSSRADGIMVTLPTGGANRLEVGYWDTRGSGTRVATEPLAIYAATVKAGDPIKSSYLIRNIRISWNYLTYPVPAGSAKLRVKTFWEVQYTRISPVISFPNAADPTATVGDKKAIIFPGVGVGLEYVPSKRFRVESRLSGMALPGRSRYADAEVSLIGSVGSLEIFGGGKGFHFRTSPKSETYQQGTIWGPMFGVRWVFK